MTTCQSSLFLLPQHLCFQESKAFTTRLSRMTIYEKLVLHLEPDQNRKFKIGNPGKIPQTHTHTFHATAWCKSAMCLLLLVSQRDFRIKPAHNRNV